MFKKKNLWLWGLAGVGAFLYFRGKKVEAADTAAAILAAQPASAPTASGDYVMLG
jgi:hypothetical protein